MKISKQDLINKLETLVGEIQGLSKSMLNKSYYEDLAEEVNEWIEEIRNNAIEFVQ